MSPPIRIRCWSGCHWRLPIPWFENCKGCVANWPPGSMIWNWRSRSPGATWKLAVPRPIPATTATLRPR
ncbi:MAG: hypothetical protein HC889_16355 [Synechococcaceae cyanobacterium SM1_2_3]|nr:hypothetical protein [Synechococcaceae cyanobacterium SM1_2_3]